MKTNYAHVFLVLAMVCVTSPMTTQGALFQPDSATASSEFNSLFDIGNTIDGSGLPVNFGPSDSHSSYAVDNHWTTAANQVLGTSASFDFNNDATIGTFYLWNHRSNDISANPYYAVTLFDLILRDVNNLPVLSLLNQSALGGVSTAQGYSFLPLSGVRSVDFIIRSNQGLTQGSNPNYTGLAEVAFSEVGIPEPSSVALCLIGTIAALVRRSRCHR
jgi:hypothetical protein